MSVVLVFSKSLYASKGVDQSYDRPLWDLCTRGDLR